MKRVGHLYDTICEPENLRLAFWKAQRGKRFKPDVVKFRKKLDAELGKLQQELLERNVHLGDYHYFTIYDPKERLICAASFRERVLHHAIINVVEPIFERYQIFDSYACRKGKGTYKALNRARTYSQKYAFYLKLDIRKYFYCIDHLILKEQLRRRFKDQPLLKLMDQIIDSYEASPLCGIPIGNLTSQYFANHYLGSLDHFVKNQLCCKAYIRYMDDFVLWSKDKIQLTLWRKEIAAFLSDILMLELKTPALNRSKHGLSLLGYRIFPNQILLTRRSRNRFVLKLNQYNKKLESGEWTEQEGLLHIEPMLAFIRQANTKNFRKKLGIIQGSNQVNRGGSWNNNASNCRSANRNNNSPENTNNNLGFRPIAQQLVDSTAEPNAILIPLLRTKKDFLD